MTVRTAFKTSRVTEFNRFPQGKLLVKRSTIVKTDRNGVVIAVLFSGGKKTAFVQAYSLDSWVVTGCFEEEVISTEQARRLLGLTPRYDATDENWGFLVEKAKLGNLKEVQQELGLGLRGD